jgi:hypothetical protein
VRACVRRRLEPRVDKEARQKLDGAVGGRGQQREPPASWVGCAARGGGAGEAGAAAAAWSRCRVSSWAGVLEVLDVLRCQRPGVVFRGGAGAHGYGAAADQSVVNSVRRAACLCCA